MFYQLPPVGNPIDCTAAEQSDALLTACFLPYKPCYFASGTAALAAAIAAAIRFKGIDKPEVILPAYGCPDLVSAAIFAGARPVLVDLAPDRPWMDLEQVAAKTSPQTVAIIAVHLFGMLERMAELRLLAEQANALLIEDSAQAFPGGGEQNIWTGDMVVLSFGRGKPVSLLGGGAVLCREDASGDYFPAASQRPLTTEHSRQSLRLKAALYNGMISPRLYWIPLAMPFLHLGETRYHPLPAIDGMDTIRHSLLPANIAAYREKGPGVQSRLAEMLGKLDLAQSAITDLPAACGVTHERRLLRYPLLVDATKRDRLFSRLHRHGLGASTMYPEVLSKIPGLENRLAGQGPFPAAESFATRILTLPTHARVSSSDIDNLHQVLVSDI